jgi:hypothetical protein
LRYQPSCQLRSAWPLAKLLQQRYGRLVLLVQLLLLLLLLLV